MKKLKITLSITLFLAVYLMPTLVHAYWWTEPVWYWEFHEPSRTVSPTDIIVFGATFYNDASSTQSIVGFLPAPDDGLWHLYSTGGCCAQFNNQYIVTFGDLSQKMNEKWILLPGESIDFTYMTLTPRYGNVAPGTYGTDSSITIILDYIQTSMNSRYSAISFTVVPEPISFILFITGGTLFVGRNFLRKRRSVQVKNRA